MNRENHSPLSLFTKTFLVTSFHLLLYMTFRIMLSHPKKGIYFIKLFKHMSINQLPLNLVANMLFLISDSVSVFSFFLTKSAKDLIILLSL